MNPWLRVMRDGREIINTKMVLGLKEYRGRVAKMLERQGGICCLYYTLHCCSGPLRLEDATFEHEDGRGMGGGHRDDRIMRDGRWYNGAACWRGNAIKGSTSIDYNIAIQEDQK